MKSIMGRYLFALNHLLFCCVLFALLNFILLATLEGIKLKQPELHNKINPLFQDDSPELSSSTDLGDKDYIVKILRNAGVKVTSNMFNLLPTKSNFTSMYGSKPIILGTETCSAFQKSTDPKYAFIGPAGCYNTGTNLLYKLLHQHCKMPHRKAPPPEIIDGYLASQNMTKRISEMLRESLNTGILDDLPWDKHAPVSWRASYRPFFRNIADIRPENVLPVAVVKDPYNWMASMCRHPYNASWKRGNGARCFSFTNEFRRKKGLRRRGDDQSGFPGRIERKKGVKKKKPTNALVMGYHLSNPDYKREVWYDNVLGLWNSFYGDYLNLQSPHIITRYEDLLLHTESVITTICHCAGGDLINNENGIHLTEEPAKDPKLHGRSSGLVDALIKYGDPSRRTKKITENSLHYIQDHLNLKSMEAFSYSYPPEDEMKVFYAV